MSYEKQALDSIYGLLILGINDEALIEARKLLSNGTARREVLLLCLALFRSTQAWSEMAQLANELRDQYPDEPELWISLADARRNAASLGDGLEILREAEARFEANPHLLFQLGCYEAQMGNLDTAERYVRNAIKMDNSWAEIALNDGDLSPIASRLE